MKLSSLQRRWPYLACILTLLLYLAFMGMGNNIKNAHATTTDDIKQATFTVDNVTVNLQSNIMPNTNFQSTAPGSGEQKATDTAFNPTTMVAVIAVPYGIRDNDPGMPVAEPGIAPTYRSLLSTSWTGQTQAPQDLPAINIFGANVTGTLYHVLMPIDSLTPKHVLIAEWVSEAGSRVWIVRAEQEETASTTNTFLPQLLATTLTSTTLGLPSTMPTHTIGTIKAVAVGKNADGRLTTFGISSDNNIWSASQTSANSTTWNNLAPITYSFASSFVASGNPVVGTFHGALQLFARGSDNNIWHIGQAGPNGAWTGIMQPLQTGYSFQGNPTVGNDANGNIEVFARGSDNNIWHNAYTAGKGWSGWSIVHTGLVASGDPIVGTFQGALQLFARGSDNNIWHIGQAGPNGAWTSSWQPLQTGHSFQGTPAAGNDANGNIEVFARGTDNSISHNAYTAGKGWSGWSIVHTGLVASGDPIVGTFQGALQVFTYGSDSNIWHIEQASPNDAWTSPWQQFINSNNLSQGAIAAGNNANGNLMLFRPGYYNVIQNSTFTSGNVWSDWTGIISGYIAGA